MVLSFVCFKGFGERKEGGGVLLVVGSWLEGFMLIIVMIRESNSKVFRWSYC